ncbi:MAG: amino acid permease [Spirochaetales bacterium]|nr:amino acid permease [Spirochaetales bacterium]
MHQKLKKTLSGLDVFCIASGAMISSGLFILPGLAFSLTGPALILSYLIAGLVSLPGMLSLAEMTTAMPRAGGDCFAVIRSLGPAVGTVAGLMSWFSLAMKSSFALVGMSIFTELLLPAVDIRIIAVFFCALFFALNLAGVKEAGRVQKILVLGLFAVIIAYVVFGLPALKLQRFAPFAPHGAVSVFSTAGMVFVSYAGLLKIASIAEEIKNPVRTIPLGMLVSLVTVVLAYLFIVFVTVGVLEPATLSGSMRPLTDGAAVFAGAPGALALTIAAVLAFLSTANAGIMTSARSLVPLARDHLFPRMFATVSRKRGTPYNALILTAVVITASLFLHIKILVEAASLVLILTNILTCVSVIILRASKLQNYRPKFRAPFFPWLQIAGILCLVLLVVQMGWEAIAITGGFIVAGLATYVFFGRIKGYREYALLHLVERITAKEITANALETELREILFERDDISKDRFDGLVERAVVLDDDQPRDKEEFFRTAAAALARRLKMPKTAISALLSKREKESSTALTPLWAVPHIIIPGKNKFHLLIARNKRGIRFSPEMPAIKCVFILAGTKDERNFHLRALSSIAQIIQNPKFEHTWLSARRRDGLRDIILLGKRLR